nr:hypothetical protein BaRGS_011409 [Batillaria attramentaria]
MNKVKVKVGRVPAKIKDGVTWVRHITGGNSLVRPIDVQVETPSGVHQNSHTVPDTHTEDERAEVGQRLDDKPGDMSFYYCCYYYYYFYYNNNNYYNHHFCHNYYHHHHYCYKHYYYYYHHHNHHYYYYPYY